MKKHILANEVEIKNLYAACVAKREAIARVNAIIESVLLKIFDKHDFPVHPDWVEILEVENLRKPEHVMFIHPAYKEDLLEVFVAKVGKYAEYVEFYPDYASNEDIIYLKPGVADHHAEDIALIKLVRAGKYDKKVSSYDDLEMIHKEIELIGDIVKAM